MYLRIILRNPRSNMKLDTSQPDIFHGQEEDR